MSNNIEWPYISEDGKAYTSLSQIAEDYKLSYDTLNFMTRKYGIREAIERCKIGHYGTYNLTYTIGDKTVALDEAAKYLGYSRLSFLNLLKNHSFEELLKRYESYKVKQEEQEIIINLADDNGISRSTALEYLRKYGVEKAETKIRNAISNKKNPISFCDGYGYVISSDSSISRVLYDGKLYTCYKLAKYLNCDLKVLKESVKACINKANTLNIERLKKLKVDVTYKGKTIYGLKGIIDTYNTNYRTIFTYYSNYTVEETVAILDTFSEPVYYLGDSYKTLGKFLLVFKDVDTKGLTGGLLKGQSMAEAMEQLTGIKDNGYSSTDRKAIIVHKGVSYYTLSSIAKAFYTRSSTVYRLLKQCNGNIDEFTIQLEKYARRKEELDALDLLVDITKLPKDKKELLKVLEANKQKIKIGCKEFGRVKQLADFIGKKYYWIHIAEKINTELRQGESLKVALEQATGVLWLGYGRDNSLIVQYECPVCKRLRVLEIAEHTEFIGHSEDYCKEKAVYKD